MLALLRVFSFHPTDVVQLTLLFFFFFMTPPPPRSTLFPYTTLFRSQGPLGFQLRRTLRGMDLCARARRRSHRHSDRGRGRSEEHTSELQSPDHLVCRLLLEKKKKLEKTKNNLDIPTLRTL